MPLNIPLLIIQRPRPNLKQPHTHPRPHLGQLDRLEARLDKNMVAHLDSILNILKGDNAVSDFGRGFAGWEEVFEDLYAALAELGAEAFEDEVRVGFRDCAARGVGDVGAEDYVAVECE
jgi:hypothetical protein